MLAALGATAEGGSLDAGPAGLAELTERRPRPGPGAVAGVELVMASDVDNPLLGINGATKIYGPQKGLPDERLVVVDGWLQRFAEVTDRKLAAQKGAGAAGGLGYALMLLGATRDAGRGARRGGRRPRGPARGADLVVTGEGAFDFSSRSGKVPYGVARGRQPHAGAVHRPRRPGAHRVAGDAGPGRGVGVLGGRPGGGGACPRAPAEALAEPGGADRAHLVALSGRSAPE